MAKSRITIKKESLNCNPLPIGDTPIQYFSRTRRYNIHATKVNLFLNYVTQYNRAEDEFLPAKGRAFAERKSFIFNTLR